MTVDDFLIDGIRRGDERAVSFASLHPSLLREDFWDNVFAHVLRNDPMRERAEHLMQSGLVDESTTIADCRHMATEQ